MTVMKVPRGYTQPLVYAVALHLLVILSVLGSGSFARDVQSFRTPTALQASLVVLPKPQPSLVAPSKPAPSPPVVKSQPPRAEQLAQQRAAAEAQQKQAAEQQAAKAKQAQEAAQQAKREAQAAKQQAQAKAKQQAEQAKQQAEQAKQQAEAARLEQSLLQGLGEEEQQWQEQAQAQSYAQQQSAAYQQLIEQQVFRQWSRPASARNGMETVIEIHLLPTGELHQARLMRSSGDEQLDQSALRAIQKVHRFQVPEDLAIFERYFRVFQFTFRSEDLNR